jgi:excisionase family DNA binding protein
MAVATLTTEVSRLMTCEEAAEYLNVRAQTLAVWRTTKRYQIPYLKIGAGVRYRKSDLDAWLESRTVR